MRAIQLKFDKENAFNSSINAEGEDAEGFNDTQLIR